MTRNGLAGPDDPACAQLSQIVQKAVLLSALAVGCASGESPTDAGRTASEATGDAAATPPTAATTEPPTGDPPTLAPDEPSTQDQAARTAFRTMTSPGVSPQEWEAANQKLQDIGAPALPVLVEGLGSDVRFTGAIGLGMRMRLGSSFGLRADVRAYYAVVSLSGGSACVDGSCLFLFGGSGIWQGDVTAGLELRF